MIDKSNNKNTVIYIASNGRSGSTILELLLNTFDSVFTLGEVNVIPWELKEERQVCGCGKTASKCEFWQKISKKAGKILGVDGEINRFRESHGAGKILRWSQMLKIFRRVAPDFKPLKNFCVANQKFFNSVSETLEKEKSEPPRYLIDSSKDFYRLFWLSYCGGIDLRVIHLVKEPRAFVYSMTGHKGRPPILKTARMAFRYLIENALIGAVCELLPKQDVYFLRYEDLVGRPDEAMAKLGEWLTLDYRAGQYKKFRSIKNHGLGGNIARMRNDNIYLDEKWRKDLAPFVKIFIKIITYPLGKKYGYF